MIEIPAAQRVAIAGEVGLNEQYLYQCFTGRKRLPFERCPDVERSSGGAARCEALRDDITWIRVPDPEWPVKEGRPCADLARRKERGGVGMPASSPEPAANDSEKFAAVRKAS